MNAISQADVIAVKELSEISREFERRELRSFTDKARAAFSTVRGDKRRLTWVYSEAAGDAGLVENNLASFWKPALSHAFAGWPSRTRRHPCNARASGHRQRTWRPRPSQ